MKLIMENWRRFCEQTKISPAAALAKYGKVHNTSLRVKKFVRLAKAYADKKKETLENVLISPEIEHFFGNKFWSGGIHSGTSRCAAGPDEVDEPGLRNPAHPNMEEIHPEWKEFIPVAASRAQRKGSKDHAHGWDEYLAGEIGHWYNLILMYGCGKHGTLQNAIIFLAKEIERPLAGVVDPG